MNPEPNAAPPPVPAVPAEPSRPPAPPRRGCLGASSALLSVLLGAAYVANPGLGVFELIPDNLPVVGNLDEAAATTLIILGLQYLFGRRRRD